MEISQPPPQRESSEGKRNEELTTRSRESEHHGKTETERRRGAMRRRRGARGDERRGARSRTRGAAFAVLFRGTARGVPCCVVAALTVPPSPLFRARVRTRTRPWSRGGRAYRRGRRGGRNRVLRPPLRERREDQGNLESFSLSLSALFVSLVVSLPRAGSREGVPALFEGVATDFVFSLFSRVLPSLLTRPLRSSASWPRSRGSTGLCLSGSACELTTRSGTTPSVGTGEGPSSDCKFVQFVSSPIPAKDLG